MKAVILFCFVLFSITTYAQVTPPDTLQLETRSGEKILLIGKDMGRFKAIKVDSMIKKALMEVKDSIAVPAFSKKDTLNGLNKPKWKLFILLPHIGAALVKGKLSPFMGLSLDFAPQRRDYLKAFGTYTFINVGVNAYYLFEKDATGNHTYTNIFLDASVGNRINNKTKQRAHIDEFSFGAGYLVKRSGDYFRRNTIRLFVSAVPSHSYIRIKPEIYITDDFKKVFPGVSAGVRFY